MAAGPSHFPLRNPAAIGSLVLQIFHTAQQANRNPIGRSKRTVGEGQIQDQ